MSAPARGARVPLPHEVQVRGVSTPNRSAGQRFGRGVRRRLLWTFVSFGIGAGSTWHWREAVFGLLYVPAGGSLSPYGRPIFTGPTEILSANIHLAIMGGLVVALPVLTVSVLTLASPWLNRAQRLFAVLFVLALFACFLGGAAFAYFVMLPTGLRFLLHFGEGVAIPVIRLTEYMSLVTAMIFWFGVIFELPLAMFLLAKFRIVSYRRFRQLKRTYVVFAAFILSAIITPTLDIVNQALVAVPIIVLYEVGLLGAWLARPRDAGHRSCAQKARAVAAGVWRRRWIVLAALLALAVGGLAYVAVFVWDGRVPVEVQGWVDGARETITRAAFWSRG